MRKEVKAVTRSKLKVEVKAITEEKKKGKRGVKPDANYLPNAVNKLEKLYLDYESYPYWKYATVEY